MPARHARPRRPLRRRLVVASACVGLALGVGACGDGGGDADLADEVVDVGALDNVFRPEAVEVAAGTTVRWTNAGRNDHNVVPVDDGHDFMVVEPADLRPGAVAEVRFTAPGTYRYYCSLHGTARAGMIGVVEVRG